MAIIKQSPEDFVVKELYGEVKLVNEKNAKYVLFVMMKKNLTTLEACQRVAKAFGLSLSDVGYAGNKDKHALTFQLISIPKLPMKIETIEMKNIKNVKLKFFGYSREPIKLGNLKGNLFEIKLKNLQKVSEFNKIKPKLKEIWVPNYFDDQRFSKYNIIIGKNIIKNNFKEAVKYILKFSYNDVETYFGYWRDFDIEKADSVSRIILEHLLKQPKDFVGAIRKLPPQLALMYVHAYQSYLFNKVLNDFINVFMKEKKEISIVEEKYYTSIEYIQYLEKVKIPLIGFATDVSKYEMYDIGGLVMKILADEGITFRDFVVHSYPLLTTTGSDRNAFNYIKLEIKGFKNPIIMFKLPPGAYATIVIKTILSLINEPLNIKDVS